jgi:purine nucleosidase
MPALPVVFDTDIGGDVDDALALALALASPELHLVGVCVVHGDAEMIETRARIAARLLGLAGRPDVPVLRGQDEPLPGGIPYRRNGSEGEGLLDHPMPPGTHDAPIAGTPAAEWLVEASRHQRVHVVATGPFTNVAIALQRDPTLPQRLDGLTVMGGMFHPEAFPPYWRRAIAEGTVVAANLDYNTRCDPQAAGICADSGVPTTYVPIEVTLHTQLSTAGLHRMHNARSPFCQALARLTAIWSERHFRHRQHGQPDAVANLHDPLAMAAVLPLRGHWITLRDEPTRHATAVDAPGFERFYLDRVLGAFG